MRKNKDLPKWKELDERLAGAVAAVLRAEAAARGANETTKAWVKEGEPRKVFLFFTFTKTHRTLGLSPSPTHSTS